MDLSKTIKNIIVDNITISEQIDIFFRKYALYVIQSRGIPNFYDSLTPVQRLILEYSPTNLKKTIGVIGEVFSTGLYHHGDMSMSKAISKLAKPFGCSDQILIGDGFFGSPVNPSPAAPRYTQIKISPKYRSIIEKYSDLNEKNEEGGHDWLHVDYPIGLSTHVVGIAVGYSSVILPRKPEEVVSYLDGNKTKKLKPYFRGFNGKITKLDSLKSSWLMEGDVEVDVAARTFKINSISPLQRYETFFTRINNILNRSGLNYKLDNFSTDEVKMIIKLRCLESEFKDLSELLAKETKQIVTENLIFVKDGAVLEYDCIEDYLDDFTVHRERTFLKRFQRDLLYLEEDLEYLEAKLLFLKFMQEKKREVSEIQGFLKKFNSRISRRLESISLVKLNKEEIISTELEIKQRKSDIKDKNKQIKEQSIRLKESEKNNSASKKMNKKSTSLLENSNIKDDYHNGIKIFNPEDLIDEVIEEEQETINEDE